MENYYVLSFDRGDFFINLIQAEDRDKANEKFEEEMNTNFSTDIMLDNDDFEKFCEVVKNFKAVEDKIYNKKINEEIKKDLIRDEVRDVEDLYETDDDIDEEMEVKADLHRKYDLTNAQEDLILAKENE